MNETGVQEFRQWATTKSAPQVKVLFEFFSQSESLSYSATPELLQLLTPDLW
jgi:hypothetical protein